MTAVFRVLAVASEPTRARRMYFLEKEEIMKKPTKRLTTAAISMVAISLSTLPAAAHVGDHGAVIGGSGFAAGFVHPFTGIDHLVAIVGVGALAALRGRGATLSIPAAFIAAMVLGAILPMAGLAIPGAEVMIVLSLLAVGLLLGLGERLELPAVHVAVGTFAFFHGVAHGNEMALSIAPAAYVLGFTAACGLLLCVGRIAAVPVLQRLGRKPEAAQS